MRYGYVILALVVLGPWARAQDEETPADLPLREVVLFTSGVGYFAHGGTVTGNASYELKFPAKDINDLLKSMVLLDLDGGTVSSVTYASRDPLTRTLKSFALDLTDDPSLADILVQARGEPVQVAAPTPISGVIVGVENRLLPMVEGDKETVHAMPVLNLLTSEGLTSVPIHEIRRLQFQRAELDKELREALAALAAGRDMQKKTVAMRFRGEGKRRVHVAYVRESPVWKTSYRLVLDDGDPLLQGWAIVENVTDEDWKNVQLTLVSGRPISFLMELYEPLYVERPEVQLELYESLRPRKYTGAVVEMEREKAKEAFADAAPSGGARRKGRAAPAERASADKKAFAGTRPVAHGAVAGELFQYTIEAPVTLPRQKSAMLPIVNAPIKGTKVSIYNERVHAKHPLNGLQLENTTGLHLMQGPITVFDGGTYAGDAQIDDVAPGAKRLISYAIDLATEVDPSSEGRPDTLESVRLAKGTLIATRRQRRARTYTVRATKPRRLLIEHPYASGWKLVEPAQATERARDVYRFALDVKDKAKLTVVEERRVAETVRLASARDNTIEIWIRMPVVSENVKVALQQVLAKKTVLERTRAALAQVDREAADIARDQSRIRQNMERLDRNSQLYARYVETLTKQEDQLASLRAKATTLKQTEAGLAKDLDDYLLGLDVR